MRSVLVIVFLVCVGRNNALYSDEENALLPNLFHLDDHDRCLLQPGGLYCLGEFDLAPVGHSPMYENITEYATTHPESYNRSRLYRGYCVSFRCPTTEKNASLRFEQCVDKRARRYALSARLRKLQYCTTQQQHAAKVLQPPDKAQQLFLRVVYAIIALNIVGTIYDVANGDDRNKNGIIKSWSVRASWRRLTATYNDGDPRLTQLEPIQGMRVVAMLLSIYTHSCIHHYQFYVTNPNFLEILRFRVYGLILTNGTSLIQMFVIISSFLTAYNLLLKSEKHQLSFLMLPVLVAKRIIRIAPVHLVVIGFSATYWSGMRSGALSSVIEEYSVACRRKFWAHAFFLNNVVEKQDSRCLTPTWYLSVDMQLFIVSNILTIIMYRQRHQALRLYATLFVISAVTCGLVAYCMGYQPIAYDCVPEKIRGLFINSMSFGGFYIAPWASLPACFMGLFLAHLHYELQQAKYEWNQNQWFKQLYQWSIIVAVAVTVFVGMAVQVYKQPWVTALLVIVDRPFMVCMLFCMLIGCINVDGGQRRFFGWQGWRVPARLSLPVMLCHWLVSVTISARPAAFYTSVFDVSIDYLATLFYGYAISVPVALLVEIPVQRFFAQCFLK